MNELWSRNLRIRLELIRWETHAYPGFGEDPQAVINKQIPQDFDLFIGIMWYRFGTPTNRAESGTFEEFQRAKQRHDANPDDLQLMIYFKDAPPPVSPSELDPGQLSHIATFRDSLGSQGGLYWSFQTTSEFEQFVRMHLTRYIQKKMQQNEIESSPTIEDSSEQENEDKGLLELTEEFEDSIASFHETTLRIVDITQEIAKKIEGRGEEIVLATNTQDPKAIMRLLKNVAGDMDQYVHRIEAELPLFNEQLNASLGSATKALEIYVEINRGEESLREVQGIINLISELRVKIEQNEVVLYNFKDSVDSTPRITSALSRSKRNMVNVIQRQIDEFGMAQTMLRETEISLTSIIEGGE